MRQGLEVKKYDTEYVQIEHIEEAWESLKNSEPLLSKRGKIIAISAQCAMGKSTVIRQLIQNLGNPPVMFVACRIVHATDGAEAYNLELYSEPESRNKRSVSTTINSLHRFQKWLDDTMMSEGLPVLVLDEVRSILAMTCSNCFRARDGQLPLLDAMIKYSRLTICADADLFWDGMCRDFMIESKAAIRVLEYTRVKDPYNIKAVCGKQGFEYWKNTLKQMMMEKKNLFVFCAYAKTARGVAAICSEYKVTFKLYYGEKDGNDKEKDFQDVDKAWEDTQVIIATSSLTVAVDPKTWHCDKIFVASGGGLSCLPRDMAQAIKRMGRKGIGNDTGQLSSNEVLMHFDMEKESDKIVEKPGMFEAKKKELLAIKRNTNIYIEENFQSTRVSSQTEQPTWWENVRAHQEVERESQQCNIIDEWRILAKMKGWGFEIIPSRTETERSFNNAEIIKIADCLHDLINSNTRRIIEQDKRYACAIQILATFVFENKETWLDPNWDSSGWQYSGQADFNDFQIDESIKEDFENILEQIRQEDRPNSILTEFAKNLRFWRHPLSPALYKTYMKKLLAFHEQRNFRTKPLSKLNEMDEEDAKIERGKFRMGRAQAFINCCKELNISARDIFNEDKGVSLSKPEIFTDTYDTKECDLKTLQNLEKWAGSANVKYEGNRYANVRLNMLKQMMKSFGIIVEISQIRKADADGKKRRKITNITLKPCDEIKQLVESSDVKYECEKEGMLVIWAPFPRYVEMIRQHGDSLETPFTQPRPIATTYDVYEEKINVDELKKLANRLELEELEDSRVNRTKILNLLERTDENGIKKTRYYQKRGRGRQYACDASLQNMTRWIRNKHDEYYWDIDMVNAIPCLCAHRIKKEEFDASKDFPAIMKYGLSDKSKREEILDTVKVFFQCERDIAKQLFCSLLNGGTIKGWISENKLQDCEMQLWPEFIHAYSYECFKLFEAMGEKYPALVQLSLEQNQPDHFPPGKLIHRKPTLYHNYRVLADKVYDDEHEVLNIMQACAKELGYQFDVLMFDGGLLRKRADKNDSDVETLMTIMEESILKKTNVAMRLAKKDM